MATANRMIQKGSTGADVKLLQGLLNQKVPLPKLPQGKKLVEDGIFGSKTDAATRTFQQMKGLKVDGIVGPKTWGALGVTYTGPGATPAPPAGKPKFEEKTPKDGFDGAVNPPWQMVPMSGQKTVILKNAANLNVVSRNTGIATVEDVPKCFVHGGRELIIKGKTKGTTFIDVKDGAITVASLEIAVKTKKTIQASFHLVEDNAGHKTSRSASSVDGWVKTMNDIFLPQANIQVTKKRAISVKINKNLGAVVRFSKHLPGVPASEHEWDLVTAKGDASADFNVFFVWEYEQDINPNHDDTDAGTLGKNCIFEDHAGTNVGDTLAHELGHTLGVNDFYGAAEKPLLMYGITDQRGQKIPKAHANTMNP
ncbi:MAG: peptidoglycan-binding protein [Candidatus Competibacteraceae bacterium]|nr:peptidoglycan-binding protein [Candidatus Competibacteraceae bacterium]